MDSYIALARIFAWSKVSCHENIPPRQLSRTYWAFMNMDNSLSKDKDFKIQVKKRIDLKSST